MGNTNSNPEQSWEEFRDKMGKSIFGKKKDEVWDLILDLNNKYKERYNFYEIENLI